MNDHSLLYNQLPSIYDADSAFCDRERIFKKLAPVFAKYDPRFGLTLVHRHCKLRKGERMVARDHISQPEKMVTCFPERWLATGEPYEFNARATISPPDGLLKEFREVVGDIDVLGVCFISDEDRGLGLQVERTEGRKNITEVVVTASSNQIPTCWLLNYNKELEEAYICVGGPGGHHTTCDTDSESE